VVVGELVVESADKNGRLASNAKTSSEQIVQRVTVKMAARGAVNKQAIVQIPKMSQFSGRQVADGQIE